MAQIAALQKEFELLRHQIRQGQQVPGRQFAKKRYGTKPQTLNPQPQTLNPKTQNPKPKTQTPNTKHQTSNHKPQT
ncbi:hypothetical protein T484DRAFT_1958181 [Baffinella frigidus]|nr:hypothetical protein T484DRAFT_1958181 [Cryptophyta sp. CCMP2293]